MHITFSAYYTLILAVLVLLLGKFLVQRIRFLRNFNIPEPVAGGLVVATVIYTLHEEIGLTQSLIHICRCRRYAACRSWWSPYTYQKQE